MITAYTPINVEYKEDNGDISTRTIIPTISVPQDVRSVDLSNLGEQERDRLVSLIEDYSKYVDSRFSAIFNFQEWVEQTSPGETLEVPWRTFKLDNLKVL